MNRQQRRRANRQLQRAIRGGGVQVEGGLTPMCGWPGCGKPVGFGIREMGEASAKLRAHYDDEHDGQEPV